MKLFLIIYRIKKTLIMMNETLIYKYPLIKELIESNSRINPIYLNPHANLIEFSRHNTVDAYRFSRHPSNKAVEMMMMKSKPICLQGLVFNTNTKIGPLLEKVLWRSQNPTYYWKLMSQSHNPAILAFIEKHKNPDEIIWFYLSQNECEDAVRILEKNQDKIDWDNLSENSFAIDILKKNTDKIVWKSFCKNSNPKAIEMIEQMLIEDPSKINFVSLSCNPNAIHIISQHLDKVSSYGLSWNPNAMDILMQHPELIDNGSIIYNPSAMPYIETLMARRLNFDPEFQDFSTRHLTYNPNCVPLIEKMLAANMLTEEDIRCIKECLLETDEAAAAVYELDYKAMSKVRSKLLYIELMEKALHPSRVGKWLDYHCENGGEVDEFEL